jgi:hypothetical protein
MDHFAVEIVDHAKLNKKILCRGGSIFDAIFDADWQIFIVMFNYSLISASAFTSDVIVARVWFIIETRLSYH